jgi:hypothetical protein
MNCPNAPDRWKTPIRALIPLLVVEGIVVVWQKLSNVACARIWEAASLLKQIEVEAIGSVSTAKTVKN